MKGETKAGAAGFSAYSKISRSYANGDLVIFDGVVTNVGNYYNPDMSTFHCANTGLYVFSVTVMGDEGSEMDAIITTNNGQTFNAFSDGFKDQGSVMVVVQCNSNEKVWVESFGARTMLGNAAVWYSSFSGFLLQTY